VARFICAIAILWKGGASSKSFIWFWFAIGAFCAFMNSGLSYPVWHAIPILQSAVQFPFRLGLLMCLAETAILVSLLPKAMERSRFAVGLRILIVLLVAVPWTGTYCGVLRDYYQVPGPPRALMADDDAGSVLHIGWLQSWTPRGFDLSSALRAATGPRVKFETNDGTVKVISWAPRHIEFETNSSTGGLVVVNQFYYPAWQAARGHDGTPIQTKAAMPSGLVELPVPSGQETVRLDIPVGFAEHWGQWISLCCLMLSIALAMALRRGWLSN
jgi:hypothetical protein